MWSNIFDFFDRSKWHFLTCEWEKKSRNRKMVAMSKVFVRSLSQFYIVLKTYRSISRINMKSKLLMVTEISLLSISGAWSIIGTATLERRADQLPLSTHFSMQLPVGRILVFLGNWKWEKHNFTNIFYIFYRWSQHL